MQPRSVNAMGVIAKLQGRVGQLAYEASVAEAQVDQLTDEVAQLTTRLNQVSSEKAELEATMRLEIDQLREEVAKLSNLGDHEIVNVASGISGEENGQHHK